MENLYELNKDVIKGHIELGYHVLIEIYTGLGGTMPCLSPVVPRTPEAQLAKGASDVAQRLEIGPSGGKIVREVVVG